MVTDGHLLGGRIAYRQPASGFRSGIEPVLLAASIPARAGEHVLEAGTGAGAALLCLTARVPGIHGTGVEIDPAMADLARTNAEANGFERIRIVSGDLATAPLPTGCHHAMANPPYHPEDGSPSPHPGRETAKRGSGSLIRMWIDRLAASLRPRGTLTLIVPAGLIPVCLEAMTGARCPCASVLPLWPKAGRPAKLVLVRGIMASRAPMRLLPGLILHQEDGTFTADATNILADAAALALGRLTTNHPVRISPMAKHIPG